jgi:hypothetical protein
MAARVSSISSLQKGVALKVGVFAAAVMLGTIATYLYAVRSTSVLYAYVEAGSPTKEPAFSIFNPFRDRGPERSAEEFLELLKAGQCAQAMAALPVNPERRQDTCEREGSYPLASWSLGNRRDEPQKVIMYYRVKRENLNDIRGPVWVTVEKQGGRWHVTRYESIY